MNNQKNVVDNEDNASGRDCKPEVSSVVDNEVMESP